jgi:hypothetical protein
MRYNLLIMGIETKTFINVNIAKDTRIVIVDTKIITTDIRPTKLDFTPNDAIRVRENRITREKVNFFIFSGGVVAATLGGIALIITGIENLNPDQIGTGVGAVILGRYFWGSAKKHISEANLVTGEKNEIIRKRKSI